VRYLKRAWQGRVTGKLDLSALDLTDIPLEVTGWAPQVQITPSQLPDLAPEEGAEEVQAVEKRGGRAGARGGSTGEEGAGGNGVSERGGGQDGVGLVGVTVTPGGAVSVFGGLPTPQEQHSGGEGQEEGASVEARDDKGAEEDGGGDAAVREAAYAVDDAAGREEQKKQVVEAMAAADMLQGEDADMDAQGYDNRHDEDVRDFEVEEVLFLRASLRACLDGSRVRCMHAACGQDLRLRASRHIANLFAFLPPHPPKACLQHEGGDKT
jgi:hypothetical protein